MRYFRFAGGTAEYYACDVSATSTTGNFHDPLAILRAIQSFDLPDIRLHARILQRAHRLKHQRWPESDIVEGRIWIGASLFIGSRYQKLEHESLFSASAVIGKSFQPLHLSQIADRISFGIVAHQRFRERWLEHLNVRCEVCPIFELEFG